MRRHFGLPREPDSISDYRVDRMCDAQILDVLVFEPKRLADKLREELNSFVAAYRELEAEEDEE